MKSIQSVLLLGTLVAALPALGGVSPHETINATIDGAKITVVYGRPYTKDPRSGEPRKIWGKLVPYGKVWRTGADAATLLTTDKDLQFGDTTVPAGKYSLYTQPEENGKSKLIINKQTGQWGTEYDKGQDLARVDLKKETLDKPVTQFTITIDQGPGGGGVLTLKWEDAAYAAPFTVQK